MGTALWAGLHQEAMLQPKTAAAVIAAFGEYINNASDEAQHMGYLYNPETKKFDIPYPEVSAVQLFQTEAARHFLATNLQADLDGLQKALEAELAKLGEDKARAKQVLGQFVDWARDPSAIAKDVAGKLLDFTVDKVIDWLSPTTGDIQAKYDAQLSALKASLNSSIVDPSVWTTMNGTADQLVRDIESGRGPSAVTTPSGSDSQPTPSTFTGDPEGYVGKVNLFQTSDPLNPITDDFLTRDSSGKPTGVKDLADMNSYQRQAYLNWLHDPAIQNYFDTHLDAVEKAAQMARR